MSDFDFHYVLAPTGEISGESVLQQTEDGINAVGQIAQSSDDQSAEALLIAKQANATADNAQSSATNAAAEAEGAVEKVNTLANVVSGYDEKITAAVSAAEGAVTTANGAVSTANAAKSSAEASATAAENAETSASASANNAQTAAANAASAITQAEAAATSAALAQSAAEAAQSTAVSAQTAAANSAQEAGEAVQNCYALRVTTDTLTDGEAIDTTKVTPPQSIKVGDLIIDAVANVFEITLITDESGTVVEKVATPFVQAISYAAEQSLTETQQRQALSNAGFFSYLESVITTNGGEVPS